VDKDLVFGEKKQSQRTGHCGASSDLFLKKAERLVGFMKELVKNQQLVLSPVI
jgi:hypothetical protein